MSNAAVRVANLKQTRTDRMPNLRCGSFRTWESVRVRLFCVDKNLIDFSRLFAQPGASA
jgi:hypothetical protein